MKTTKILISITLFALATTSFAQQNKLKDILFHSKSHVHSVAYTSETASFKNWTADLQGRLGQSHIKVTESPAISKTYYASRVEVSYESESGIESWMSEPFPIETAEQDLSIEPWMTVPFVSDMENEVLSLEPWMIKPFGNPSDTEEWVIAENRD